MRNMRKSVYNLEGKNFIKFITLRNGTAKIKYTHTHTDIIHIIYICMPYLYLIYEYACVYLFVYAILCFQNVRLLINLQMRKTYTF